MSPWTAARQASLSITISLSLFKLMSIESVMPSKHLILCPPLLLSPSIPKKGSAKQCSNYHIIALISHTSKVMLKILQARLQQYMNHELTDVQAGFRKGRGRSNCQHPLDHRKSKRVPEKTSTSALLIVPKPLTVKITTNWKILKRWEYQITLPAS